MKAKIENGILYLEPETEQEFEYAYDWIEKYDTICDFNEKLTSLIKIEDEDNYDDSNIEIDENTIAEIIENINNNKQCKCGNPNVERHYNHINEQIHEGCDVCGYARQIHLLNSKEVQKGEKPKFGVNEVHSSYVLKTFFKEGYSTSFVDSKNIPELIDKLENDQNELLLFFSVTYKDKKGCYKTQIFKNGNR